MTTTDDKNARCQVIDNVTGLPCGYPAVGTATSADQSGYVCRIDAELARREGWTVTLLGDTPGTSRRRMAARLRGRRQEQR